jgi:low affinity Fe/Cu permease
VASLQLSLRNIVSGFVHHFQLNFQLKMNIASSSITILSLVMLQELYSDDGQNEDQVRILQTSSFSMRLA